MSNFKIKEVDGLDTVNDEIKVSVIIPIYNADVYLRECLSSVVNQTYKNIEIICVNDGSTDHSNDILIQFSKKDSRIKVLNKANGGPSAARNAALEAATGDYISFVDADDFLELDAYEVLVGYAMQKQEWDIVMFGGNVIGSDNEYLREKLNAEFKRYVNCKPNEVIFSEKIARPFLWLHFIKRELFNDPTRIRFDENFKLGEDQLLQFEYVPRAKNIVVLDRKLYNYRVTENASLMHLYSSQPVKKTDIHFRLVEKAVENWKKNGLYEIYKDDIWSWGVNFIYWTIVNFPNEFKKQYSKRVLDLLDKYQVDIFLLGYYERAYYEEMKTWADCDFRLDDEVAELTNKIINETYEINETLKSRAFKLGKFFTLAKNRMKS